jgi:hypothetical protein
MRMQIVQRQMIGAFPMAESCRGIRLFVTSPAEPNPTSSVGSQRWIYVGAAMGALYLNVFLDAIQAFHKLPAVHTLGGRTIDATRLRCRRA